jgi:hypothetical protein
MSKIEVNTIDVQCGSSLTLGGPGTAVTLACGATQTGFGRTGTVDWCTTAKTSPFTSVSGKGYFVNTSGGAVTVTLPSSPSAGDIVAINDLNGTANTNAITVGRNSSKINGGCEDLLITRDRQATTVIYTGSTQGWVAINEANVGGNALSSQYNVQYLVVAGGGGGGTSYGGGGGAGGLRQLASKTFAVTQGVSYTITIGGGGAHGHPGAPYVGCNGSNSVFSTITSAGGGGGGMGPGSSPTATDTPGLPGGSGGGGGAPPGMPYSGFGAGNTPPVSPPQGNPGAPSATAPGAGGGGGAGAAGSCHDGGTGSPWTYLGPLAPSYGTTGPAPGRYFAGGGGGYQCSNGGAGGGGDDGQAGTVNTGGGSGGRSGSTSGAGGSGIVVIRHVTSCGACASGGNATATCGSDTIRVFTGSGTFTA